MKTLKNDQISQIIDLIFTIRRLMHDKATDKKKCIVPFLHLITLRYVFEEKPSMKETADFLSITPPSATSLIDTLIKQELVERQEDEGDRRSVKISITKKGEEYFKRGKEAMAVRMRSGLEKLNNEERKDLAKILNKLIINLN